MTRAQSRRHRNPGRGPLQPSHPRPFAAGVAAFEGGDLDGAEAQFRRCLPGGPDGATARFNLGVIMARRSRFAEAVELFAEAVDRKPDYAEAWLNLGLSLNETGEFARARAALTRAGDLLPGRAAVWAALAQALAALADPDGAERACRRALAADPRFTPALYRLLDVLRGRGDGPGCLLCCDALVAALPNAADVRLLRGHALDALGRVAEADAEFDAASALAGKGAEALMSVGTVLTEAGRLDRALGVFDRLVAAHPDHARAHAHRATLHQLAGRFEQALDDLKRAMALAPGDARVYYSLGNLFLGAERPETAVGFFLHAVQLQPDFADAFFFLAKAYGQLGDFETAEGALDCAVAAAPERYDLRMELAWSRMNACTWRSVSDTLARDVAGSLAGGWVISPFKIINLGLSNLETLLWIRAWREKNARALRPPVHGAPTPARGARIRVGYVSADFRNHATAFLITELFERHDRARVEVFGYNIGRLDDSAIGARMIAGLDHFVDVSPLGDREAAERIARDGIDVLVDLKGYTNEARPAIFSHRPAAVQVNYLGFPGTMATPDMDYIVADAVTVPAEHEPFYDERVVRLPHSYQPNVRRPRAEGAPARAAHGLPEAGFVFCCFNNSYKLTPLVFDIWMRLLGGVPGAVLWLFEANGQVSANLRGEARARGVDPDRLVFAPRLSNAEHIARIGLADLFLDTLPINAHTTASDALWAGVPVLTCLGSYFPGRVAASLLGAVGLPDLVTHDLAGYEALALALARDPARLGALRDRLASARDTAPLFDTPRYARGFEAALARMVGLRDAGRPPEPFTVEEGA